jgi:flavin reductase (DIM6/NTAB) family NADH-FMN oxidoreductase RutF
VSVPAVDLPGVSVDPADDRALRQVFGAFPTGVTVVAALADGEPAGLAANSFTSVSLDPPIVSVCLRTGSRTGALLRTAGRVGVSVLAAGQESVSRRLAAAVPDRFAGIPWRSSADGAVLVDGAAAWLECAPLHVLTVGDHDVLLLSVHASGVAHGAQPLVFHASRYTRLEPGTAGR